MMMMGRIVDRSDLERGGRDEEQVGSRIKDFRALASHYGEHAQESMLGFTHIAMTLREYMRGGRKDGEEEEGLDMREVMEDICRLSCNCYTIVDEEERAVGIGLFPIAALMNHSCSPSCVQSFHGRRMQLRALRDIEEGEELTLSYIDPAEPLVVRQEELRKRYFFSCTCNMCEGEEAETKDREKTRLLAGASKEEERKVDGLLRMARDKAAEASARPQAVLQEQLDAIRAAELVRGTRGRKEEGREEER
eukprot:224857-Hanusia_phi.AAC.1